MTRTIHLWVIGLALAGCADTPDASPRSISEFCATTSLPCPMTWSAAQDPTAWGGCGGRTTDTNPLLLGTCTNVRVAEMWGVDASTNYSYDASTGALIGVTSHLEIREPDVCVAGACGIEVCRDPAPRNLCP
jgi:hypothetical protein